MGLSKILVFASGTADGGGSGFEKLVLAMRSGVLDAQIVAVVSNHQCGGVREKSIMYGIPFVYFPKPWNEEAYCRIAEESGADYFALSGWLKKVVGLDLKTRFNSRTVFNIHPAALPEFGGKGLYGKLLHTTVLDSFRRGFISHSAVSMHFVTDEYDQGPVFFRRFVHIYSQDTLEKLVARVQSVEHQYQAEITQLVVNGKISWNGCCPSSLSVPHNYLIDQQCDLC